MKAVALTRMRKGAKVLVTAAIIGTILFGAAKCEGGGSHPFTGSQAAAAAQPPPTMLHG